MSVPEALLGVYDCAGWLYEWQPNELRGKKMSRHLPTWVPAPPGHRDLRYTKEDSTHQRSSYVRFCLEAVSWKTCFSPVHSRRTSRDVPHKYLQWVTPRKLQALVHAMPCVLPRWSSYSGVSAGRAAFRVRCPLRILLYALLCALLYVTFSQPAAFGRDASVGLT